MSVTSIYQNIYSFCFLMNDTRDVTRKWVGCEETFDRVVWRNVGVFDERIWYDDSKLLPVFSYSIKNRIKQLKWNKKGNWKMKDMYNMSMAYDYASEKDVFVIWLVTYFHTLQLKSYNVITPSQNFGVLNLNPIHTIKFQFEKRGNCKLYMF